MFFCFVFFFTDIEVQEMQHSQPESSLMRAEDDDNSSDDELLETQTWRVQRLERNEFLDSLKVSCHILEPKQSLLEVLLCIHRANKMLHFCVNKINKSSP